MSNKGQQRQPAHMSERLNDVPDFETKDFALARDRRRKASKAARVARRKNRR